jgi:MFS family permease
VCAACGNPSHVPAAPQRFAALHSADTRNYLAGAGLSMMGDSIEHVISYWVMFQQFHSPALAGFAVISHWVPSLFSVYTGAWADRYDCRKIIQLAQLLFISVSATWGVLFLTDSLQMWHAMVLLVLHGIAGMIWAPAEQLLLHDLAGRSQLPSAVRLNSTFRSCGFLAGPALGSVLLVGLGPAFGIFANVLVYLPLTIWLARTPFTGHLRDGGVTNRARVSPWEAIRVLREVSSQPILISMVALGGLSSFLIGSGIQPQFPEFAADLGIASAGPAYGLLLAANSAGAVLGGVLLESTGLFKPDARTAILSTLVWSLCMLGFAASPNYLLSLGLLLGAGVANLAAHSMAQTLVQLLAPPEKRGRVIGVYNMTSAGLRAGSGITIGLVGGMIGIHWSLGLSAITLAVIMVCLFFYLLRVGLSAGSREAVSEFSST